MSTSVASGANRAGPARDGTIKRLRLSYIARQGLTKRAVVASVGFLHRSQIGGALLLEHYDWRVSEPHLQQVQGQPSGAPVAVDERVDLFEAVVQPSGFLWEWLRIFCFAPTARLLSSSASTSRKRGSCLKCGRVMGLQMPDVGPDVL